MSDYIIRVRRSRRKIAERFWVTIQAGNGRTLFHSENLKEHRYALELGQGITSALDGNLIDET